MIKIIMDYWYLWLLILFAVLLRMCKPMIKGWFGEKEISFYLKRLPKGEYIVIHNIILPTSKGTTQVDHIVVSIYGVFVIETKNYTGWIFGDEQSQQWTQSIYGQKSRFMNPIRQNYAHVKAVKDCLAQYPDVPVIPIVTFSSGCDLKVNTTSHVVYFHRVRETIRLYTDEVISRKELADIRDLMLSGSISGKDVRRNHIRDIHDKKSRIQSAVAGSDCPNCSGTLIERRGKYGVFLGCTNYPKCRFTKHI